MSIFKHILALIVLVVILGLVYPFLKPSSSSPTPIPETPSKDEEPVACTMDAMMCPDGTYVGRSGPNCEFRCPHTATATSTTSSSTDQNIIIGLNQPKIIGETTITVWAVTEDSRCPSDVVCVQAGHVRVAIGLKHASGTIMKELEPGATVTTETLSITLVDVTPYPISTHKTVDEEYRFTFEVKGK